MIDSTPTPSGAVVDEGTTGTPQPMVEADAGGEAAEPLQDALTQAGQGARPVALQGERALEAPEDRLDALTDGSQMRPSAGFVLARRAHHEDAALAGVGREGPAGETLGVRSRARSAPSSRSCR